MKLSRLNTMPAVLAILGALALQSCDQPVPRSGEVVLPLWKIELGNPRADADAAYKRGDKHLLGIMGYSISVPGAPNDEMPPGWSGGVRPVAGTSDAIRGVWQQHFMGRATAYAEAYNRELLAKKPTSGVGLCVRTQSASAGAPIVDARVVTPSGDLAWDEEVRKSMIGHGAPSDSPRWARVCVYQAEGLLACPEFDCTKLFGGSPDPHADGR